MVNRELIEVFSEIAREKNVERSELGSILEGLFLHLVERERGDSSNCSVIVNLDKGEFEIYVEKTIVDDVEDPVMEITLEEISQVDAEMAKDLEIGDTYVEIIDPMIFGRRMIHMAKQFFSQRLQDVEKKYIYEDYANRVGEIVIGTVHQVQRDNAFVNIDHAELRMPRKEQIKSERYRRGDSMRAVIKSVEITSRGPDIVISRSDNHFLYKMFEMEVPEIEDNVIEITSIARNPGERAKIIVRSNDRRIDPVGACVGMRGSRIQAIVRELNNEKIDIVNFSDQSEILISRALSPAKPLDLYIDDDRKYCIAIFDDDDLELAIGRGGVNVNLASSVTLSTRSKSVTCTRIRSMSFLPLRRCCKVVIGIMKRSSQPSVSIEPPFSSITPITVNRTSKRDPRFQELCRVALTSFPILQLVGPHLPLK